MLRLCCFSRLRWRMRGAIRFDGPAYQEQAQNETQNHLFLFGQAVHARQCSSNTASPQWEIGSAKGQGNISSLARRIRFPTKSE
jgi:hypothetical protein